MPRSVRQVNLELDSQDSRLLESLAQLLDCTLSDVLRWSLRYYATRGPWTDMVDERAKLLRGMRGLTHGPTRREVTP